MSEPDPACCLPSSPATPCCVPVIPDTIHVSFSPANLTDCLEKYTLKELSVPVRALDGDTMGHLANVRIGEDKRSLVADLMIKQDALQGFEDLGREMASRHEARILDAFWKPPPCDLTGDPLAVQILKRWWRQPWNPVHQMVLLDRMMELGYEEQARRLQADNPVSCKGVELDPACARRWPNISTWSRNQRRRVLGDWRNYLVDRFGDFTGKSTGDTLA